MKTLPFFILTFIAVLFAQIALAQIPVTVTNPNNTTPALAVSYSSLANALTAINSITAMSGPITLTLAEGSSETAPPKGLTIGSATLNPVLSAVNTITIVRSGGTVTLNAGIGTASPNNASPDGILKIAGANYITIDGLTLTDGNTTNPATMEFGVAMFKLSSSDGAQNNTIKNCTLNMQRINNANGSGPMVEGSVALLVINSTPTSATSAITPLSSAGANSYNKFYSNSINNGNYGIVLSGYNASSPFSLGDTGNDIGGSSSETGNTILNFGGGGTNSSAGIRAINQWEVNISCNTINNNNSSGVNHSGEFRGIYAQSGTSANVSINNNTVTVKSAATSHALTAIDNGIGSTATTNTININNNSILNCSYTSSVSATFTAILNSSTAKYVNINGNNISSNSIGTSETAGECTFQGIYNSANLSSQVFSVSNNTISSNSIYNTSGTFYCVRSTAQTITLDGNNINNISIPYTAGSEENYIYGFYNQSSSTTQVYSNNLIYNLSVNGSNNNSNNAIYGLFTYSSNTPNSTISGNTIYNLSFSNTSTGSASVRGIFIYTGITENVSRNKIHSLTADGSASTVFGLYISSGTTGYIYNNIIGNISAPSANAALSLAGIYLAGGTTMYLSFNTVYLNTSSSGALFGSTALYNVTSTVIVLKNNIFVNLSTPSGAAGYTSAYRRNAVVLTNYNVTSNYNLFYAGTPGANNVIMYDVTNAYQTISSFKTAMGPTRESQSVTENPTFLSTTGTDNNFLHINTSVQTLIESGGTNISGIINDIDANTRQGNSGYSGTGTAPDIGADEFEGVRKSFSGDYTIGAAGDYTNLTSAITDLNWLGVSGPTRFLLIDASYTTGETYPLTISITNTKTPTSSNTVTIKPNTGVTATVQGSYAYGKILLIKNNYVTIDGSNTTDGTSRDLTIENTNPTYPELIAIQSPLSSPITNVTVKNCILINGSSGATAAPAINVTNSGGSAGYFNDIVVQNNSIQKSLTGIYVYGDAATGNGSGILITGNDLNTSGANSISETGISITSCDGVNITNNNIGNFSSTRDYIVGIQISNDVINSNVSGNVISGINSVSTYASSTAKGINITGTNTNLNITNNIISSLSATVSGSSVSGIYNHSAVYTNISGNTISDISSSTAAVPVGINIQFASTGITISKNKISNIKNTNAAGYSAIGIALASTSTTSNISASNNLIYDVAGYGKASQTTDNGYGINILSGGGYNIYYNSINLATNQTLATGIPSCLNIKSVITTANTLDIRNNIFSIPATVGTNRYAVICHAANTVFSEMNYNDYFTSGSNIGYIGSANKPDLSSWKTATGKDKFSINADPSFTGSEDLSINTSNPNCWNINGGAYPISSISSDYNNTARRTSLPGLANDIGAYEFTPNVSPSSATVSTVGDVTTISSSGNTLATITWTAGTAPTLNALYYPGENPSGTPAGTKYGNSHLDITASGGSTYTYNIVYNFNPAMLGTITNGDFNYARLAKYSSGAWQYYSAAPNGTNYTISVNGLTSFSNFALTDGNAPLPVILSSFTSSVNSRDVTLIWKTITEHNNLGFDIERKSVNTNGWTKVGSIKGNGTSSNEKSYTFEDKKLSSGKYNYRLKQIDFNNNFEYHNLSSEAIVSSPSKFSLSQNYPNPFNPETSIDFDLPFDSKISITIFDITGKSIKTIISESRPAGFHTIRFNASALSSGIYFYRIIAESPQQTFSSTRKMILLK